jgi:hypothetical protein
MVGLDAGLKGHSARLGSRLLVFLHGWLGRSCRSSWVSLLFDRPLNEIRAGGRLQDRCHFFHPMADGNLSLGQHRCCCPWEKLRGRVYEPPDEQSSSPISFSSFSLAYSWSRLSQLEGLLMLAHVAPVEV